MKVIEIAFTCYTVTDLRWATQFYEEVLGLQRSWIFGSEDSGFVEYDIGPGTLAITNYAPDWKASAGGGSIGLEVEDFDGAIKQFKARGYLFYFEPLGTPVCHMAVVSDSDGNSVTIHRRKVEAPGVSC